MKIKIIEGRCVGAGQCELFAPSLFRQDDETGLVTVLKETLGEADYEAARAAVHACPTKTIYLEE